VFEHPQFPRDLRDEIYEWLRRHAAADRAPGDTDQQFIYKARKKALGAFKRRMWRIDAARREAIGEALEAQVRLVMGRLNVAGTASTVARFVDAPPAALDRDREIAAAC
jgi:fructose-bisphosphate aldolase, class II